MGTMVNGAAGDNRIEAPEVRERVVEVVSDDRDPAIAGEALTRRPKHGRWDFQGNSLGARAPEDDRLPIVMRTTDTHRPREYGDAGYPQ